MSVPLGESRAANVVECGAASGKGRGTDPCVYGALHLLDESGVAKHAFHIRNASISVGRALANDVRLLLEDVSREHCRLVFDGERNACLHVIGVNGLLHNGQLVKPEGTQPATVSLADGDQLQMSTHTLLFSYPVDKRHPGGANGASASAPASAPASATPLQRSPETQPASSRAMHNMDMGSPALPHSPRRQSARLRARPSSPLLRSPAHSDRGAEPRTAVSPVPRAEAPPEPHTAASPVLRAKTHAVPCIPLQDASPLRCADEKDTSALSLCLDLVEEQAALCDRTEDAGSPRMVQAAELTSMPVEDAVAESAPADDGASTRAPPPDSHPRAQRHAPQSLPRAMPRTPPSAWSPSKNRKVSLRTATLLKRSSQYLVAPMSEGRASQNPFTRHASVSPSGLRTSSSGMDLSNSFRRTASADPDGMDSDSDAEDGDDVDMEEVEKSLELSSSEECPPAQAGSTDYPAASARPSAARTVPIPPKDSLFFSTPQPHRHRTAAARRLSDPRDAPQPMLKHRSSWQWLRDLLYRTKGTGDGCAGGEEQLEEKRCGAAQDEPDDGDADEFHESMDTPAVCPHGPSPSWGRALADDCCVSALPRHAAAVATPDMHDLKHVFAVPKDRAPPEETMADFRHMLRAEDREYETRSHADLILEGVWFMMASPDHKGFSGEAPADMDETAPMHNAVEEMKEGAESVKVGDSSAMESVEMEMASEPAVGDGMAAESVVLEAREPVLEANAPLTESVDRTSGPVVEANASPSECALVEGRRVNVSVVAAPAGGGDAANASPSPTRGESPEYTGREKTMAPSPSPTAETPVCDMHIAPADDMATIAPTLPIMNSTPVAYGAGTAHTTPADASDGNVHAACAARNRGHNMQDAKHTRRRGEGKSAYG
ncbi:hypothetical protein MSPP1_000725 [Malassezia sp. CBS 17886]|nr:hypothetical protein MSPP1_000725 [Malassezia sp. CBS 17886]